MLSQSTGIGMLRQVIQGGRMVIQSPSRSRHRRVLAHGRGQGLSGEVCRGLEYPRHSAFVYCSSCGLYRRVSCWNGRHGLVRVCVHGHRRLHRPLRGGACLRGERCGRWLGLVWVGISYGVLSRIGHRVTGRVLTHCGILASSL